MSDVKFSVDYSKRLSKCKKCKAEISKGDIRLAKLVPNFFGGDDSDKDMKQYYHVKCMFESFKRARATTKKIESADDIEDFASVKDADKKLILSCIDGFNYFVLGFMCRGVAWPNKKVYNYENKFFECEFGVFHEKNVNDYCFNL